MPVEARLRDPSLVKEIHSRPAEEETRGGRRHLVEKRPRVECEKRREPNQRQGKDTAEGPIPTLPQLEHGKEQQGTGSRASEPEGQAHSRHGREQQRPTGRVGRYPLAIVEREMPKAEEIGKRWHRVPQPTSEKCRCLE